MSTKSTPKATGKCLCGAVRFEITGALREPTACHCGQCRRQTGHFMVATRVERSQLKLTSEDGLTWYRSSPSAKRGFCRMCGSTLFWSADNAAHISIAAGALDPPTGLRLAAHIFIGDKSDYYDMPTDAPLYEGDDEGAKPIG